MKPLTEYDILGAIAAEGGTARLLGGRAVAAICGEALPAPLRRPSSDIDLVTRGRDRRAVKGAFAALGCEPEHEFNLLNGKERMIFHAGDVKIDVFIDVFRMCHTLALGSRLDLHPVTLSAADLLLTKLQVVRIDRKDLIDLAALLLACPLEGTTPNAIDTAYLGKTLGSDWGLWRTATGTLTTLRAEAVSLCGEADLSALLCGRIDALTRAIEGAPRSMSWRMRAMIGERTVWYELPEEPTTQRAVTTA